MLAGMTVGSNSKSSSSSGVNFGAGIIDEDPSKGLKGWISRGWIWPGVVFGVGLPLSSAIRAALVGESSDVSPRLVIWIRVRELPG